jgi:hypothetical protein
LVVPAVRRARFHYDESKRIGERTCIARISTEGLVAATIHVKVQETITEYNGVDIVKSTVTSRDVHIPVWIRNTGVPDDRSEITVEQLVSSGADLWLSITELRRSNLDISCTRGHEYEWLACGQISKGHVTGVMPFDGKTVHPTRPPYIVMSLRSMSDWIYDWNMEQWRIDRRLARLGRSQRQFRKEASLKRARDIESGIARVAKRRAVSDQTHSNRFHSHYHNGKQSKDHEELQAEPVVHCRTRAEHMARVALESTAGHDSALFMALDLATN